jgi:predicted nucleotidyltransferase
MSGIYDINEIKSRLQPVFDQAPVYRAVLFGSYAKGVATEQSDVDIVLDSRGQLHGLSFYGVLEDAVTALDKKIDMFEISEIRNDSPIMDEINRQGVVLYER